MSGTICSSALRDAAVLQFAPCEAQIIAGYASRHAKKIEEKLWKAFEEKPPPYLV
jgi:hypothetical protein